MSIKPEDILKAAKTAHEVNRAYCLGIGDTSQLPWEEAPLWQQESALRGAKNIADNPKITPKETHNNWMNHKFQEGWVYGEVKDAKAKTHPCLVAYEQLPSYERAKDFLFDMTVRGVLGIPIL